MPQSLGENFAVLEEKARALPICPGRWRLGTLNFWDDNEKAITALAVEGGEKRLVFQHGGEYGMVNYNMLCNSTCIHIGSIIEIA